MANTNDILKENVLDDKALEGVSGGSSSGQQECQIKFSKGYNILEIIANIDFQYGVPVEVIDSEMEKYGVPIMDGILLAQDIIFTLRETDGKWVITNITF